MPCYPVSFCCPIESYQLVEAHSIVDTYLQNFESLAKAEKWDEILVRGKVALEAAQKTGRVPDEAKICAQLTSTAFYQGDYTQALKYASRCHELSAAFADQTLFIRSLYLESAVFRALAGKALTEGEGTILYEKAVEIGKEALNVYERAGVSDQILRGKIYFNLGAAHADNTKGDLIQALNCYFVASECFGNAYAIDDLIRTNLRVGKIYLLQNQYELVKCVLEHTRLQITNERLTMHADYLEAQLLLAQGKQQEAEIIIQRGLQQAINLGAKEDERRFKALLSY